MLFRRGIAAARLTVGNTETCYPSSVACGDFFGADCQLLERSGNPANPAIGGAKGGATATATATA